MSAGELRQGLHSGGVKKFNTKHGADLNINQAANQANQAFERCLSITGGRLAIKKTMYYALFMKDRSIKNQYKVAGSLGVGIVLTKNFGKTKMKLQMYTPDEAHKLLGMTTEPASTLTDQIQYMKNQAKSWNDKMICTSLQHSLKVLSFQT